MYNREVLLLGDINMDTVWPLPEFPVPGRDGLTEQLNIEIGGAVINSAIVLDRLGISTGILGCVGDDVWADSIKKGLSQSKINQAYLQTIKNYITGITFIVVTPDGERTMFSYRGANVQLKPEEIDEEVIQQAGLLHISGYALMHPPQKDAAQRAIEFAKKHNIPISLDSGLEPVLANLQEFRNIVSDTDICVTGQQEVAELFNLSSPEEGAAHLLTLGIQIAAIKLGEKGSYVASKNGSFYCPPFKVRAVDTTGAGDSFTAGILFGWLNKMSFQATAVLASALGALASTVYGAGFSLPEKQDLLDLLGSFQGESAVVVGDAINEIKSSLAEQDSWLTK